MILKNSTLQIKTMRNHYIHEGAPIPFYIDRKGIIHAPDAFRKNVAEHVDRIMEEISKDENLCVARNALEFFFEETGLPEPIKGTQFFVGMRVEFIELWEFAFPHFYLEKGEKGTVDEITNDIISIKLDNHIEGAEEWDNCVHLWRDDQRNGDIDFSKYVKAI